MQTETLAALNKLESANAALKTFADSEIVRRKGGWYVRFETRRGVVEKRWMTRGQDFYPVWHRKWAGGGTASTALSQLIRWLRGQPVLPLSSWRYWTGPKLRLGRDDGPRAVEILQAAGYPETTDCVLCHKPIVGGLDWWKLDGVSGPCCSWTNGCRQEKQS